MRKGERTVASWLSGALVLSAFGAVLWLEGRRPLRRETEDKLRRDARNLAVAGAGALVAGLLEKPAAERAARLVERRRLGLLKLVRLPGPVETAAAVVLLDYTLYLWHVLTHRSPFLWRFHVVHHADLDLSATTALRFHFAELLLAVPWRAAQILSVGVSPRAFSIWQTLLMVSILFHHSNVRLPAGVERRLARLVVTPRLHGIHHSIVREEADSNWSSGLTVWDRLHGTLRLDVPQEEINVGVPAYREPEEVTLGRVLALPFGRQRPTWRLGGDGPRPRRETA
ncbi:MAG TPA: sterol desaturase family protein [Pyrinomonadaceae bacterium]|nr:sterol desaturase family protein [Pyrinomonadaceae bacterium]